MSELRIKNRSERDLHYFSTAKITFTSIPIMVAIGTEAWILQSMTTIFFSNFLNIAPIIMKPMVCWWTHGGLQKCLRMLYIFNYKPDWKVVIWGEGGDTLIFNFFLLDHSGFKVPCSPRICPWCCRPLPFPQVSPSTLHLRYTLWICPTHGLLHSGCCQQALEKI